MKMDPIKTSKFEKILILNDYSFDSIRDNVNRLLYCMKETNEHYETYTVFMRFRLIDSDKYRNAKELILEWATPYIKEKDGSDKA